MLSPPREALIMFLLSFKALFVAIFTISLLLLLLSAVDTFIPFAWLWLCAAFDNCVTLLFFMGV